MTKTIIVLAFNVFDVTIAKFMFKHSYVFNDRWPEWTDSVSINVFKTDSNAPSPLSWRCHKEGFLMLSFVMERIFTRKLYSRDTTFWYMKYDLTIAKSLISVLWYNCWILRSTQFCWILRYFVSYLYINNGVNSIGVWHKVYSIYTYMIYIWITTLYTTTIWVTQDIYLKIEITFK